MPTEVAPPVDAVDRLLVLIATSKVTLTAEQMHDYATDPDVRIRRVFADMVGEGRIREKARFTHTLMQTGGPLLADLAVTLASDPDEQVRINTARWATSAAANLLCTDPSSEVRKYLLTNSKRFNYSAPHHAPARGKKHSPEQTEGLRRAQAATGWRRRMVLGDPDPALRALALQSEARIFEGNPWLPPECRTAAMNDPAAQVRRAYASTSVCLDDLVVLRDDPTAAVRKAASQQINVLWIAMTQERLQSKPATDVTLTADQMTELRTWLSNEDRYQPVA